MTVLDYRSAPRPADTVFDAHTTRWWPGWAIYLGTSWTWCIGMFLPVLLIRDYGIGGFLVFAIPNILGAAAMAWVLRDPVASRRVVAAHRPACLCFSAVTVAFHVFFAVFLVIGLTQSYFALLGLFVLISVYFAARGGNAYAIGTAIIICTVSWFLFAWGVHIREFPYLRSVQPRQPIADLWGIAPVSAFGFALCPYLDLTFHRARQHTTVIAGRLAFGAGFGVVFLAMILYTLSYSGWLQQLMAGNERLPAAVAGLIGLHLLVQTAQTTALHAREMFTGLIPAVALLVAIAVAPLTPDWVMPARTWDRGYGLGETIYRGFMGSYALVFPAYVWLCMIGSPTRPPTTRALVVLVVSVVFTVPCFWLGFIEGRMIWLLPGLGIVLLARLFVPRPLKFTG
jgi:hypothetical protein